MYTVLIQNQKTMDSFYEHLPLFNAYINAGQMDVCLWNESGRTLEQALPDLRSLTDGKNRWKAVIVRYEDDRPMAQYKSVDDNPYDFYDSGPYYGQVSEVPLVRLTQQLSEPLQYLSKERRNKEVPEELLNYDGFYPESIVLISVRHLEELAGIAASKTELRNPDFAQQNGYPASCRFAVIDRLDQGKLKGIEDDFFFWTTVMLIARNRAASSFLKSGRLHSLSVELDKDAMEEVWNEKDNQLQRARKRLDKEVDDRNFRLQQYEGKYPDFSVPTQRLGNLADQYFSEVSPDKFVKIPKNAEAQKEQWDSLCTKTISKLQDAYDQMPAEVQKNMPALSRREGYQEDDVDMLSDLQTQRLEGQLEALNAKIAREMAQLPDLTDEDIESLKRAKDSTVRLIENRISTKKMMIWLLGLTLTGACGWIMSWIYLILLNSTGFWWIILFSVLVLLAPTVLALVSIYREKKQIKASINSWNELVRKYSDNLKNFIDKYQEYLTDILSYRNGQSYLVISGEKQKAWNQESKELEHLHDQLNVYEKRLDLWAQAMDIPLYEFDEEQAYEFEDLSVESLQKLLFPLEPECDQRCMVEGLGKELNAPFSFVRSVKIEMIRERRFE